MSDRWLCVYRASAEMKVLLFASQHVSCFGAWQFKVATKRSSKAYGRFLNVFLSLLWSMSKHFGDKSLEERVSEEVFWSQSNIRFISSDEIIIWKKRFVVVTLIQTFIDEMTREKFEYEGESFIRQVSFM